MKWIWHAPDQVLGIDFFVNPLPALAILGMAINDHYLKRTYPGWLTGKVSDFLGVFYFPIFICALICLVARVGGRPGTTLTPRMMGGAMVFTTFLLAVVKLNASAAHFVATCFSKWFFAIQITPDPTDLIALSMLGLSYLYAREFFVLSQKS